MQQSFVAEIRLFCYGAVPHGWIPCDGRLLEIALYQPLFSILGFQQGGDLMNTFALPRLVDLQPLTFGSAKEGVYPRRSSEELMIDPFIGEIRIFGGNFVPAGWACCDGRMLQIEEHNDLFELIGHSFGGDQSTFQLPDLRERTPGPGLQFIIALAGTRPVHAGD